MATVSAVILKHHQKQDGTWNVKVRVSHESKSSYIDTNHFVTKAQLDSKLKLKKVWVDKIMVDTLNKYREKISELGERLDYMDCHSIKEFLTTKDDVIDIFEFAEAFFERERAKGRITTVITMRSSMLSLRDYWGNRPLPTDMFTSKMLEGLEAFLRSPREIERKRKAKGTYISRVDGLSHNTVVNRMSNLRAVFNAAKSFYNDEGAGIIRIKNNPFSQYKMNEMKATRKRNLSPEVMVSIRDLELTDIRAVLARDLFMLSFYLCGMNAKDMYEYLTAPIQMERLEYNRSKTKGKRKDSAFISIFIPDEARILINKYAGLIQSRYVDNLVLNAAISFGMRFIGKELGIDKLTFYHARHTFATIARKSLGFSLDDVAMALNHTDQDNKVTGDYIGVDWTIIDKVQSAVIDVIRKV